MIAARTVAATQLLRAVVPEETVEIASPSIALKVAVDLQIRLGFQSAELVRDGATDHWVPTQIHERKVVISRQPTKLSRNRTR